MFDKLFVGQDQQISIKHQFESILYSLCSKREERKMSVVQSIASLNQELKRSIEGAQYEAAKKILSQIKGLLMDLDQTSDVSSSNDNAALLHERTVCREAWENAVFLAVRTNDKVSFQRAISSLKPYYTQYGQLDLNSSPHTAVVLGLNLLFLLVENRLADFHCQLEVLSEAGHNHAAVTFCTQLEQHLVVGSYDQVLNAAANPPYPEFSFFLISLLETVRVNIGDCMAASYNHISLKNASKVLMFHNDQETLDFINDFYPAWVVVGDKVQLAASKDKTSGRSEEISSMSLIAQTLSYATELERIV